MNLKFLVWFRNFWNLTFSLVYSVGTIWFRNIQRWWSLAVWKSNFVIIYNSLIVALLSCVINLRSRILFRILLCQERITGALIFAQSDLILHIRVANIRHIYIINIFVIWILLVSPLILLTLWPIILFALSWTLIIKALLLPRFVLICSHEGVSIVRNISGRLLITILHNHVYFRVAVYFFHHLNILSVGATHVTFYYVLVAVHRRAITFFHFHYDTILLFFTLKIYNLPTFELFK